MGRKHTHTPYIKPDVSTVSSVSVKVGAITRGCSGGRGSDDTRGYGVGSGDVGKELPRGIPVNLRPYGRTCP